MVTPTSYLQTLANNEAIAFVASLQKVKDHLSQELQWASEQVQQKTAQLQGIETLLSEAEALGLVAADTHSMPEDASAVAAPSESIATTTIATHESDPELSAIANGSISSSEAESLTATIAALPVKNLSKQPRGQQGKAASAKTPRVSKPSATPKSSAAKVKHSNPSPSAVKTSQRGKASSSQGFLKSPFRDQALTEAVGNILDRALKPLSTDEVMAELYDGLPKADYDRAKHSLANILSVGRSKGTWQSTGRGRYASNAVTTA